MVVPTQLPAPVAAAPQAATPFPMAGSNAPSAPAMAMPPNHPAIGGGETGMPAGTIAEVMQVPNYTYLRINTGNGDVWAAVNSNPSLAVGQKVAMANASKMEGFNSKTLNRTFDEIWFGSLADNAN
jgi:hypothetical protein